MALCECGCNQEAKKGKRFLHGHHARINNPMSDPKIRQKHLEIIQSAEERQKRSIANKGKVKTIETRKKLSQALKGRKTPWLYGDSNPMANPEVRERWEIAMAQKDYESIVEKQKQTSLERYGVENYSKTDEFRKMIAGENHPNWKGGICTERQALYSRAEWKEVSQKVWKRDEGICQRCPMDANKSDETFHVHHILPFVNFDTRMIIENLILLCPDCHYWVHSKDNIDNEFLEAA